MKKPKFVLWYSVFIRPAEGDVRRFDIMLNTLKTYSKMPFDHVYLNILLDETFKHRKSEIDELISTHFNCQVDYEEDRYTKRSQLIDRFNTVTKGMRDNDLIFFTQNDDHPFIDFNNDILIEGLNFMEEDEHPYKSMYVSHWPEIIKLSLKQKQDTQVGNFIKFNGIVCDSIQIFNVGYLGKILRDLIIEDTALYGPNCCRIDQAAEVHDIFNGKKGVMAHIYVPLRELCVHFDSYGHVQISPSVYPRLVLPFGNNNFNFSEEELTNRMTAIHGGWNNMNTGGKIPKQNPTTPVPQKYIDTMLKCYKYKYPLDFF